MKTRKGRMASGRKMPSCPTSCAGGPWFSTVQAAIPGLGGL
jgi:hypothetical protein